jgi:predicted nucleic acid-binding protein
LIVAFDTSVLVYFFDEQAKAPHDPATGQPVTDCKARIDYLITSLQRSKAKIIIPPPALAEVLVKAQEAAPGWLQLLHRSRHFRIASFDERAAVEFAASQANRKAEGTKSASPPRAKAKFDDQIVAIASVESASIIYSDDPDIRKLAGSRFRVIGISDLQLPPQDVQLDLQLEQPDSFGSDEE